MKVGLLGGTFDPIHHGHLVAAEEVRARLGLHRVLFIPAGHPPHKQGRAIASAADRLAMVELAIAGNDAFSLSRVEIDRPGLSYTVDTVSMLLRELDREAELHFIIGLDSLAELLTWHQPGRLIQICRVVAVTRPGCTGYDVAQLEPAIPDARHRILILDVPQLHIASSDLRDRVANGLPIKYQVPAAVERYIYEHGLYRQR